ncbi:MAG: flagellar biosynthetic protein FliO [Burkholderiales bacterium]|nr:flagellar biosynthetic protein FliO [Burkholderiales bacterium]
MRVHRSISALIAALVLSNSALAMGSPDSMPSPPPSDSALASSSPASAKASASVTNAASAAASAPNINTALPNNLGTAPNSTGGGVLQVFLSLSLVLGLLIALAWLMKRFGPQQIKGGANVRIVGGVSLGGRERVLVLEIGQQWVVVGAAPGRVNALATLARPEQTENSTPETEKAQANNFASRLQHLMGKRDDA